MRTIFAVSSGEYSDYSVHFACADRQLAETIAARLNAHKGKWDDDYVVQELHLVESPEEEVERLLYYVQVFATGKEKCRWSTIQWVWGKEIRDAEAPYVFTDPDGRLISAAASYRGFDVALKIARDALARHKAEQEGIA